MLRVSPRAWDLPTICWRPKHSTTVRGGYGIYYVREDVGAVDQLSFQTPFLPIVFAGSAPGGLTNFFAPCAAAIPSRQPILRSVTGQMDRVDRIRTRCRLPVC